MVDANKINCYVNEKVSRFGEHRRMQVARLLYEISKRDRLDFKDILSDHDLKLKTFDDLKLRLLKQRFPNQSKEELSKVALSALSIDPTLAVKDEGKANIIPEHFLIEQSVMNSQMVNRLKRNFLTARFDTIDTYKEHKKKKKFTIRDYNQRTKEFYIVKEEYDFFKRCACSFKSVYCGLHIVNLGSGCAFECAYCYLQDYINSPGIVLPANIEDFFLEFNRTQGDKRIGSGEITDSLIFDHITEFSPQIVNFFKNHPKSSFEFKTKSINIDNLLKVTPNDNIIVSWSMNPPRIKESVELYTASIKERIGAAKKCVQAGYKVAFHFDPMIYYPDWEEGYENLVNDIFNQINHKRIEMVSLGTLRMTLRLKKIMENRFPDNELLDEEFIPGHDGKLRYNLDVRTKMYKKMKEWIASHSPETYIYLCMEEAQACNSCETGPVKAYLPKT